MRVAGVDWVEVTEPATEVIMDRTEAGYCTGTDISVANDQGVT
jgi:phage-related baseplate assembly protein